MIVKINDLNQSNYEYVKNSFSKKWNTYIGDKEQYSDDIAERFLRNNLTETLFKFEEKLNILIKEKIYSLKIIKI